MTYIFRRENFEWKFSETDVVDSCDFIPAGDFNPHNIHPFILHDAGFVVAVVFASNLQDALDIAVDGDKLDRFLVTPGELGDYEAGKDSEGNPEYEGITHLGNASEPFDIDTLGIVEVSAKDWSLEYWTVDQLRNTIDAMEEDAENRPDGWTEKHGNTYKALTARYAELFVNRMIGEIGEK